MLDFIAGIIEDIRIVIIIKINEINYFIDNIDCMSKTRKEFYKEILNIRYNILKDIYDKIKNQ